jgi:polysaccharide pyruvyl transferase WcaK-like protein
MSAAEVLAQHQYVYGGTICRCGSAVGEYDDIAAHQLDALKAAGYAVVEVDRVNAELDAIEAEVKPHVDAFAATGEGLAGVSAACSNVVGARRMHAAVFAAAAEVSS